ncbi:MAG: hypothetical protein Fur0025_46820 [Oscillatoriaceae cyanobacterium]
MSYKVKSSRITILGKVFPGLDVLSESERDRVLGAIDSLENFNPDGPLPQNVQKFTPTHIPTFYLLHVDPSWRVIFNVNEQNEIEISHLFMQERLDYMLGSKNEKI